MVAPPDFLDAIDRETDRLVEADEEVDIEALDFADGYLYVAGSHSLRRKSLKPGKHSAAKNRRRFRQIDRQTTRNRLYRIPIDPDSGATQESGFIDLSKRLRKDVRLALKHAGFQYHNLKSGENGTL